MKLDIISDIHLTHFRKDHGTEFITEMVPETGAQILIVAGDVAEYHWWQMSKDRLQMLCLNYEDVVFVAGNHEYYGTSLEEGDARFRELEAQISNFHFLEKEIREINGVKIAGCSLWFKQNERGWIYEKWMNDFKQIHDFKPDVYIRNMESRDFLRNMGEGIDVVITHHMPSQLSVHARYKNDALNQFFLCEMDDVILDLRPKFWVHGHTHTTADYVLGETRVICNPLGYPGERKLGKMGYRPVTIEV